MVTPVMLGLTGSVMRWLPTVVALTVGLLLVTFTVGVFAGQHLVGPDVSTYLLPAVERTRGLGSVYVDFLDIKPPLTYALFVPWVALLGSSLADLWVLYIVLLGAVLVAFWLLLRQVVDPWVAAVLFTSCAVVVVWTAMLEVFFFVTEVIGMVPILWGLVIAWRFSNRFAGMVASAFLLTAAGQVKDVYLFAPLALVPLLWASSHRTRAFASWAIGVLGAVVLTVGVLLWWDRAAPRAYLEVVGIKGDRFPVPTPMELAQNLGQYAAAVLSWLPLLGLLLLGIALPLVARRVRPSLETNEARSPWRVTPQEWVLLLTPGTILVGFLWQGADLAQYFALTVVFPLFVALAVLVSHALRAAHAQPPAVRWVATVLILAGVLPPLAGVLWFLGRTTSIEPRADMARIAASESPEDVGLFTAIRELTPSDGCLHVAYGWDASVYYLYSGVPPCTRFTAPPLASASETLAVELRDTLVRRPPDVMVMDASGMNSAAGVTGVIERRFLPLDVVARECYGQTSLSPLVFVARGSKADMADCLAGVFNRGEPS